MKMLHKNLWIVAAGVLLASAYTVGNVEAAEAAGSGAAKAAPAPSSSPASTPTSAPSGSGGAGHATIRGKVMYDGAARARDKIKMAADPVCQAQHTEPVLNEELVVNNGTLQNAFIQVKSGAASSSPAPTTPVVLDQQGCLYHPRIFGIRVGQPLEIRNSDATLHNINAQPAANKKFNIAQPTKGMKTTKTFDKPEAAVPFKCNVHPWMSGYGFVLDHPYFSVSDSSGSFTLANLPAGTYTIEAWHEKLGTQTQTVTVTDGESKEITFTFKGK